MRGSIMTLIGTLLNLMFITISQCANDEIKEVIRQLLEKKGFWNGHVKKRSQFRTNCI